MKRIFFSVITLLLAFSNNLYSKARYKSNETERESNLILQVLNESNPEWYSQHVSHRSHSSHYSCSYDRDSVISALPITKNDIVRSYIKDHLGTKIEFDDLFRIQTCVVILNSFDNKKLEVPKKVLRIKVSTNKYQIFIPIDPQDKKVYVHDYTNEKKVHYTIKKKKWMYDLIEKLR